MEVNKKLIERVKEQTCLYRITSLHGTSKTIDELLEKAASIIPTGFQYPELTGARIRLGKKTFESGPLAKTGHKISYDADSIASGKLKMEISLAQKNKNGPQAAFLEEEHSLMQSILEHLTIAINQMGAVERLRENEQRLQTFIDSEPECVKVVSKEGLLIEMNRAGLEMIEATDNPEKAIGEKVEKLIHPEDKDIFLKLHNEALKGKTVQERFRIIGLKGSLRWMESTSAPLKDPGGKIKSVLSITREVTEKVNVERELQKQKTELQKIFDQSIDLICTIDKEGVIKSINAASLNILGYRAEEMVGRSFIEFIHQDDLVLTRSMAEELMGGKTASTNIENRYIHKDGRIVPMIWSAKWYDDDALTYCVGRDATEIKINEAEMSLLINNTEEAFILMDKNLSIVTFNQQFGKLYREFFGIEVKKGDKILDYALPERRPMLKELYGRVLRGEDEMSELRMQPPHLGEKIFTISYKPARDAFGEIIGAFASARDITEKKLAEEALGKSEHRFKALVQEGSDLISILDTQGRYLYQSPNYIHYTGRVAGEMTGINAFEFVHRDDFDRLMAEFQMVLEEKRVKSSLYRFRHENGEWRWFQSIGTNLLDDPAVNGIVVNTVDMTDIVNAQNELKASEQNYRTLFNSSPLPMWVTDLETYRFLDVNQTAIDHYGYMREEFLSMTVRDIRPPEDIEYLNNAIKESRETDGVIRFGIFRHLKKCGEIIKVDVSGHRYKFNGRDCLIVTCSDLTEKIEAEEKLKESNERYELVTKATFDAIWDLKLDTRELFWGEGFKTLFGYETGVVDYGSWSANLHPADKDRVIELADKIKESKETIWQQEYRFRKSDGNYAYVQDKGIIIRDDAGKAIRILGAMQDITASKEYERSLQKLNTDLQQQARELAFSNAELEQFAYVASHDLQEPLRMISSFMALLDRKYGDRLDDKARQYINFAVDGAKRMRQIILDLLEFSRVGKHEDKLEPLNVREIINEALMLQRKTIDDSGAAIQIGEMPVIRFYKSPLIQIFYNLINNAVKYVPDGVKPEIRLSCEKRLGEYVFTVKDNGIGIKPEYTQKIFTIFQRLHHAGRYSGTGMGLAIVKKIIENSNGSIRVESDEGKGSSFIFSIPVIVSDGGKD